MKNLIKYIKRKLKFRYIAKHHHLSEKVIEKYKNLIGLRYITKHQVLSKDFIKKYKDDLNWHLISRYQLLDEEFMERSMLLLDWNKISKYRKNLSESFIKENLDILNIRLIKKYQNLSKEFLSSSLMDYAKSNSSIISKARVFRLINYVDLLTPYMRDIIIVGNVTPILAIYIDGFVIIFKVENTNTNTIHFNKLVILDRVKKINKPESDIIGDCEFNLVKKIGTTTDSMSVISPTKYVIIKKYESIYRLRNKEEISRDITDL